MIAIIIIIITILTQIALWRLQCMRKILRTLGKWTWDLLKSADLPVFCIG